MSVTNVTKDPENRTMTIVTEWAVPPSRAWQLWDDPRQLERWWGPPTYPATVEKHDLSDGGRVTYFMTSPEGERYHGLWDVVEVDAPHRLVVDDAFADADGNPSPDMPRTRTVVSITERPGGCTMTLTSTFPSTEAMEQMLAMGMEEGIVGALGQVDAVLAA